MGKPIVGYMKFKDKLIINNITLLRDDEKFIKALLQTQCKSRYKILLNGYVKEWRKGRDECANNIRKDNAGRFRANTWLRLKCQDNAKG